MGDSSLGPPCGRRRRHPCPRMLWRRPGPKGRVDLGPARCASSPSPALGSGSGRASCRARWRWARWPQRGPRHALAGCSRGCGACGAASPGCGASARTSGRDPGRPQFGGVVSPFSPASAQGSQARLGSSPPGFSGPEIVRSLDHWAAGRPAAGASACFSVDVGLDVVGKAPGECGAPCPRPGRGDAFHTWKAIYRPFL